MKRLELSKGKYTLVDDADYDWLSQWKWSFLNEGYAYRKEGRKPEGKAILMHRVILGLDGVSKLEADHINGNRLDNQRKNLRSLPRYKNLFNKRMYKRNKSGFRGVHKHKCGRYVATIQWLDGRKMYLGMFDKASDAAKAFNRKYKEKSLLYFGTSNPQEK